MSVSASQHEQWSSKSAFLLASVGFAVGLGNIWRFPYIVGENGGAAFVIVYLICAFVIGVPILMAELLIGRRGNKSPPGSMADVALQEGKSSRWQHVGHMNLLAAFLIEIVYSVIAGWVLWYLYKSIVFGFDGIDATVAEATFTSVLADPAGMLLWTLIGLLLTGVIIYSGLQNGIEKAVTILMPLLFLLLILLAVSNIFIGGFSEAVTWLFTPDWSKITPSTFLAAIGQAFFSIGVGMAAMMTFGAYMPKQFSIGQSAVIIVIADSIVALLAGLVIFPAVFHNGLDPAAGPGLIFQTLPVAFAQMPGGRLFGILFFLLLSVAAITSMVGLIETLTGWLEEHRGYARHKSAVVVVSVIAALSIFSILSYNVLAGSQLLGKDLNGLLDYIINQILLPLGGLLIAIFAGWFVKKISLQDELNMKQASFQIWYFLIRFVAPVAVLIIFIMGISE